MAQTMAQNSANDAFALSPISASGTLPSETDYHAISEAFMETSRGRWFLKEYARRNRNADTAMVLEAVTRIETSIAAQKEQAAQQTQATPLADAMEAIRAIIDDAKTTASQAIAQLNGPDALAPSRKGVRIILEVAWRLREIGYDGRICDILEAQAKAIGANHDALAGSEARDAVLSAFDLIARQIGELANNAAHPEPEPAPIQLLAENVVSLKSVVQAAPPVRPALVETSAEPVSAAASVTSTETPLMKAPAIAPPPAQVPAGVPAAPVAQQTAQIDQALAAAAIEPALLEPRLVEPRPAEPLPAEPPRPVAEVLETPASAASATAATSLGGALLARGMVTAPGTKPDPLAPLRRMSQAEKIAFFS